MSKLIRQAVVDSETRRLGDSGRGAMKEPDPPAGQTPVEPAETPLQPVEADTHDEAQVLAARAAEAERDAREKGFAAGFEQGKKEALARLTELNATAGAIIAALEQEKVRYLDDVRKHLVSAVHAAVLKIIGKDLTAVAENTLTQILQRENRDKLLCICLSPKDFERLSSDNAFSVLHKYMRLDPRVKAGGCIVETQSGGTDARLETQLEEFTSLLTDYIDT